MIDIDRMDQQLESALTDAPGRLSPATAPSPRRRPRATVAPAAAAAAPGPPAPPRPPAVQLLERGLVAEADAAMAAASHPRDAVTWTTMRALLDGRHEAARTGVEEMRRLAERTDDAGAWDRYWVQRFWTTFEWGTEEERYDVLDHCRTRAYRFDDLTWWGNLTVLLAGMGKTDEAVRAFDDAAELVALAPQDARWLDVVTNLVEAAAGLGDAVRVANLCRSVRWPDTGLVVVGDGVVCKGSVDRYRALAYAAASRWAEAEACFRGAESVHRAIGAGPLLTRTLQQASGALVAA